jgi:hypothetical protein
VQHKLGFALFTCIMCKLASWDVDQTLTLVLSEMSDKVENDEVENDVESSFLEKSVFHSVNRTFSGRD